MAAVNPRAVLKLLGAASKLPSVTAVAAKVAGKAPIAVGAALMARSVIPAVASIKTPAPPPAGMTYGPLDKLGRATGAAATITKNMINAGTRASGRIRHPPGFADGAVHDQRGAPDRQAAGRPRERCAQPDHDVQEREHAGDARVREADRRRRARRAGGALPDDADLQGQRQDRARNHDEGLRVG